MSTSTFKSQEFWPRCTPPRSTPPTPVVHRPGNPNCLVVTRAPPKLGRSQPSNKLSDMLVEEPPAVKDQAQILNLGPNWYEDRVDHDGCASGRTPTGPWNNRACLLSRASHKPSAAMRPTTKDTPGGKARCLLKVCPRAMTKVSSTTSNAQPGGVTTLKDPVASHVPQEYFKDRPLR